jgi:hypothetical protein
MSLPNSNDVGTLDYVYLGLPLVDTNSNNTQDTNSLDFVFLGLPFVGAISTYTPPPPSAYNTTQFFMVF